MIYKNLIFIHIPRTGGTSIETSLGLKMENELKHKSALEIRQRVREEKWTNSFVFSFVRNPWDRMISLYHQPYFRNKTDICNKGLMDFIQNYQPTQWEKKFYFQYLNTPGIDMVGRFENRKEDLLKITQQTGVKIDATIHDRETVRDLDYRTYYNDETRQLVYEMYFDDIKKYGYKF